MTGHIFIEGEIGVQVTAKTVRADIDNYPNATEYIVHIDSPGGDVYAGYNIGSIISNIGKPTTAHIGGMCASIATAIAMSCERVVMNPQGDFMIHLPTATLSGTAEEMRKGAEQLDRIKNELISKYLPRVSKKGVTSEQLAEMMDKETSMSPDEAWAMGFVDEVREKLKAVAKLDVKQFTNMTKEEAKGWFEGIGSKLDAILNRISPKNMVELTLADGTIVMSSAESPETLAGSVLTDETGAPLPPGQVETADGMILTVKEGGVVETVTPKIVSEEDPMKKLEEENASLKQQLAEALKTTETQAQASAKQMAEFRNEVKELKSTLEKISKQTFGDKEVPQDAPDKVVTKEVDPMLEKMSDWFQAYKSSRFN